MENNTTTVIQLTLYVTGVKKHCRKTERHFFEMGDVDPCQKNADIIIKKAQDLIEKEMKSAVKAKVSMSEQKVSYENGFCCRQCNPFDSEYLEVPVV